MNALIANPWNVAIILVLPAVVIGLVRSLKRFNNRVAEKKPVQKQNN